MHGFQPVDSSKLTEALPPGCLLKEHYVFFINLSRAMAKVIYLKCHLEFLLLQKSNPFGIVFV